MVPQLVPEAEQRTTQKTKPSSVCLPSPARSQGRLLSAYCLHKYTWSVCVCVCLDVPGIVKSLFGADFDIQLAWQQFKWHSKRLPKVAAGPAGTNLRHSVTQLHYTIYYTIYRVVVVVVVAVVVP